MPKLLAKDWHKHYASKMEAQEQEDKWALLEQDLLREAQEEQEVQEALEDQAHWEEAEDLWAKEALLLEEQEQLEQQLLSLATIKFWEPSQPSSMETDPKPITSLRK